MMRDTPRLAPEWIAVTLAFWGLLWWGAVHGVTGALNVALFLVWVRFATALGLLSAEVRRRVQQTSRSPAPTIVRTALGVLTSSFLVWHGFWLSGIAAFLTAVLTANLYEPIAPKGARHV